MTLAPIDRRRLGEEAPQNVIDQRVILLLEAGMRNAGHHREMLVRVRQLGEERDQILKAGDTAPLAYLGESGRLLGRSGHQPAGKTG